MHRETERERLGLNTTGSISNFRRCTFTGDIFYTNMDDADRKQGMMIDNARGDIWAYSDSFHSMLRQ